jgi:hypothetical protein
MSGDVLMDDGSVRLMTDEERVAYEPALRRSLSETKEFGEVGRDAVREAAMMRFYLLEGLRNDARLLHPWLAERAQPGMVRTQWATYLSERVS